MKKYTLTIAKKDCNPSDDFVDQIEIWHWDIHSQFDKDIRIPENRKYIEDNDVFLMIGNSISRINDWVGKIISCQS